MSPNSIVRGVPKLNMKYKHIAYGSNVLEHTGTNNRMDTRSIPAVDMNSLNGNKGHYFMSLHSGKRLHSYKWTELSIDEKVIHQV